MAPPAFVTPTFATTFTGALPRTATSHRPLRPAVRPHPARVVCAAAATEKSGKKKAPVVFATDMKGNFVWTMRVAEGEEDVDAITALFGETYPRDLINGFVEDSASCTICEASVKGTKEGEGYKSRIMGVALVDVETMVKDPEAGFEGGLTQKASVMGTIVDSELPTPEDVRKKLLLGAMKKLKAKGAAKIVTDVASSDEKIVDMLKACLFKAKGTAGSRVDMVCDLAAENPDPEKKMS